MAKNRKYEIITRCQMCEKEGLYPYHKTTITLDDRTFEYTGRLKIPWRRCDYHQQILQADLQGQGRRSGRAKYEFSSYDSRGLSVDQKKKHDLACELECRRTEKELLKRGLAYTGPWKRSA